MQDATDGAKQTILVLQVGWDRAVPWTKPADLKFNPAAPLEALGTIRPDKILCVMADGETTALSPHITPQAFAGLATPAGRELLDTALYLNRSPN